MRGHFQIKELIADVLVQEQRGIMDAEITGITQHSKRVRPGFLFVAIPGNRLDGHEFIQEAVARGAVGLVVTKPITTSVPQLIVADPRRTLAELACRFYGNPTEKLRVIGVTGTNGKTTLTFLLESMLRAAGREVGVIGTVNYRYAGKIFPAATTTPESIDLQKLLAEMVAAGVTDVVMEVSSHSLVQGRVCGIQFDVAAFTNLSQDHLDYHRDMPEYFAAKQKLFTEFLSASTKENKVAVLNGDDARAQDLARSCPDRVVKTGLNPGADLIPTRYRSSLAGIELEIYLAGKPVKIVSPLVGRFNAENILLAIGIAQSLGISQKAMVSGLARMKGVPGRLERIINTRGLHVYVDYAHTPDALARVGQELRHLATGRLITVFGCGGDRDRGKRPLMGQAAEKFSDKIIVTSDNPRGEDPQKIIADIVGSGLQQAQIIVDRTEALRQAVAQAVPGDTLLVAGKGHEDYQIIGDKKVYFSDQEILKEILAHETHH